MEAVISSLDPGGGGGGGGEAGVEGGERQQGARPKQRLCLAQGAWVRSNMFYKGKVQKKKEEKK